MTHAAGHAPDGPTMAASTAVRGPPRRSHHDRALSGRAATLDRDRGHRRLRDERPGERGAAVVELLVVFLTLLVPLVYVMVVMADVQRALLATSSAAREAGRVYVTGSDRLDAERRAARAYREVLGTYGMRAADPKAAMRLRVECPDGVGSGCAGGFGPGAEVRVVVTYRVPVARLPFLGAVAGPGVTIGATHHTRVDRYRGLGR